MGSSRRIVSVRVLPPAGGVRIQERVRLFSSSRVRVRFVADRSGRRVVVRGKLSERDRGKLRRLLGSLPIRKGTVDVKEDWSGRRRIVFDDDIPEKYHQPIRNLLGNLSRL